MEENMNDMHGEETPRTDLTLFSEKMQELKSRIASVIVELGSEDEVFVKPGFIGEEVTGDIRYYNSQLMKKPYTTWL